MKARLGKTVTMSRLLRREVSTFETWHLLQGIFWRLLLWELKAQQMLLWWRVLWEMSYCGFPGQDRFPRNHPRSCWQFYDNRIRKSWPSVFHMYVCMLNMVHIKYTKVDTQRIINNYIAMQLHRLTKYWNDAIVLGKCLLLLNVPLATGCTFWISPQSRRWSGNARNPQGIVRPQLQFCKSPFWWVWNNKIVHCLGYHVYVCV